MDDFESLQFDSFDDRLIELVKKHEFLYNPNLHGFKNHERKETAWKKFGMILGKDVKEVKQRWTRLRERFSREKKRLELCEKNNTKFNEVWFLYNSLTFLEPFIKSRTSRRFSLHDFAASGSQKEANVLQSSIKQNAESNTRPYNISSDKRLIELVKSHTVLYSRDKIPQKTQLKVLAWRQIAKLIKMDARSCLYRWNILRTQYLREYRRYEAIKAGDASSNLTPKMWPLYKAMSFLEAHIPPKRFKPDSDYTTMSGSTEEDSSHLIQIHDVKSITDSENYVYLEEDHSNDLLEELPYSEPPRDSADDFEDEVAESMLSLASPTISKSNPTANPEVSAFLTIVHSKLRSLKMANKNRAMEDILQYCNAIQNHELLGTEKFPAIIMACSNCDSLERQLASRQK